MLIYEDLPAAFRAQDVIHRLAAELKPEFDLRSEVWKFDLFAHPQLAQEAASEAVETDIIIISVRQNGALPSLIIDWIESWLPQKAGRQSALIALTGQEAGVEPPGDNAQPVLEYLRRAAEAGEMDFFSNAGKPDRPFFEFTAIIPEQRLGRRGSPVRTAVGQRPESRKCAAGR
jgi:hypothetical protein